MKKPTFTCAIAGPIPGAVAAACLTELNISSMSYDRFWAEAASDGQPPEVELAKIPLEKGEEASLPAPDFERHPYFASASGPSGTVIPIAFLQRQGLVDLSFDHYYPRTASVPEPDLAKIPPRG